MFYILSGLSQSGMSFSRILALVIGYIFAIVVAFGLHEYAHALTAYKLGDPTPKALGRLTINPIKHIDPYGLLGFLVVGFGWAKPVEVNPIHFKKYRRDMFFVSIAGVITNIILAFILSGIFFIYFKNVAQFDNVGNFTYANDLLFMIHYFLEYSVILNVALFVFNLIPIYPLDGFNALKSAFRLNNKFLNFMYRFGNILLIIVICMPFFDIFYNMVTGFITDTFFNFWGLFL